MEKNNLKRTITLFPAIIIVINGIIGTGIFTVPGDMMKASGGFLVMTVAWLIGGAMAVLISMVYAELAPMIPMVGGSYNYCNIAMGKKWGFACGWMEMVAAVTCLAFMPLGFSNYLGYFFDLSWLQVKLIATTLIVVAMFINFRGLKIGLGVTTALTILKVVALGVVVIIGIMCMDFDNFTPMVSEEIGWSNLLPATIIGITAYGGYNQLAFMSGEVKDPKKTIPRGLFIGIGIVFVFNLLMSTVSTGTLGVEGLSNSTRAAADVASAGMGMAGGAFIAVAAMVSIASCINGSITAMPRVGYAMASDGLLPSAMAKVNSKGCPTTATLVYGIIAICLIWPFDFVTIIMMSSVAGRLVELMIAIALIVLRKKMPNEERAVKMIGYPVSMILVLLITIALIVMTEPISLLVGGGLCLLAVPMWFVVKRIKKV